MTTHAKQWLSKLETILPGVSKQWNGKASLSTPFLDPLLRCSYWKPGQYVGFSGYEGVVQEGARAAKEILAALK